ncbi:MAG: Cj0069 family protein [Actinomycetota bacterium]|nr:Cj0069 family protein [Actinomycetota bacterium]
MSGFATRPPRIGILWRDPAGTPRPAASRKLDPLFDALDRQGADVEPLPFEDHRIDEVRARVSRLEGLLIFVNPIQDGVNRGGVDALAREAATGGVFVSADPAVITKIGTKAVLYATRDLGWGSDTELYRSPADFAARFPDRLRRCGRLVVKQGRGNGGDGVWKVQLVERADHVSRETEVRVQDARRRDGTASRSTLGGFLDHCSGCFAWSGVIVDQAFQERLAEGMLRCYFSHDEVVGFCHQWPRGLLDFDPATPPPDPPPSVMEGPDVPRYQALRRLAEDSWVPEMAERLELARDELPVIWDADFLYGPKDSAGADRFVLCEINVSAVWPFPPMAVETVAANAIARATQRRTP